MQPESPDTDPGTGQSLDLGALIQENQERLLAMIRFRMDPRLGKRLSPEDVLQETWVEAEKRLKHYDPEKWSTPFLWLRVVAQQTLTDLHRHHLGAAKRDAGKERGILSLAPAGATSLSIAFRVVGHVDSPSGEVMRDDLMGRVQQAVAGMDPVDQEILALRHFEELTNQEAAQSLGIEEKAASMRYVRALKRLRELLTQYSGFLELDLG